MSGLLGGIVLTTVMGRTTHQLGLPHLVHLNYDCIVLGRRYTRTYSGLAQNSRHAMGPKMTLQND